MVEQLAGRALDRILSSPYLRCVQTVEPLAEARGIEVQTHDALGECTGAEPALAVLRGSGDAAAACVHGDFLDELLGLEEPKGSTTVLKLDSGPPKVLERLPRP